MNTELYIARKIFFSKEKQSRLSKSVVNLAVLAIGLGIAIIIISVAIVTGFQQEIEAKVDGFAAHAQIVNYDSNNSYETSPIEVDTTLLHDLSKIENIRHIQTFATKPGIVKVDDEIQGIIAKGISSNFDWTFFENNKIEGEIFSTSENRDNKAWLSKELAALLQLKIHDKFQMYFLNEDEQIPRVRQFVLEGIYHTGLTEFDRMFMLVDIRHVQSLNDWNENQVSGYEVFVDDLDLISPCLEKINTQLVKHIAEEESLLQVIDIKEKYPSIFDWLALLDINSLLIQILMILVAGFNMISGLLVIILERTRMIGILKSIGASSLNIRRIFLYLSAFLVGKGLIWGNIVGISICLIQYFFQIIPLNSDSYFLNAVPIQLNFFHILWLNINTFAVILIMLLIPSFIIGRISPEKTIRFE
ncbi:MAG: ABC transporter permease [Mangrovibacterium sp.]